MDPQQDEHLLWVAKEGLITPLPEPWKSCKAPNQEIFYHNPETGESTCEHPCDTYFRELYQKKKAEFDNAVSGAKKVKRLGDNRN